MFLCTLFKEINFFSVSNKKSTHKTKQQKKKQHLFMFGIKELHTPPRLTFGVT